LFGGYILAFHDLTAERFAALVTALVPDAPVHLDDLVTRVRRGESTRGLFAITVDDGVAATVRAVAAEANRRQWPVTFFLPTAYLDSGDAMPFQWLDAVSPWLSGLRIQTAEGTVDLTDTAARVAFLRRLTRLMYTRPADAYRPLILTLVQEVRRRHPELRSPPAPISWAEVTELSASPMLRFESHGVTHTAVSGLPIRELDRELRESRDRIAEHTGRPCRYFCYPYGGEISIGREAPARVARYYSAAVTMTRGRLGGADPVLLPRIPLYSRDSGAVARLKVVTR
jgi:peptidoglycan/xylan/chitin deacetylase (PgdA/CDA1 family)